MTEQDEFEELLGRYWELAYSEGFGGVSHGDEASKALHSLRELFKGHRESEHLEDTDRLRQLDVLQGRDNITVWLWKHNHSEVTTWDMTGDPNWIAASAYYSTDGEWRYCVRRPNETPT